ncbi:MAG: NAD(P)H-dependent oxidoreductase subunit E [Thermoguttaceae bacterium]
MNIVICMGSSCFARGNEENLRVIENFIEAHDCSDQVSLTGKCCLRKCADGPNVIIDGEHYPKMDKGTLLDILNKHLPNLKKNNS